MRSYWKGSLGERHRENARWSNGRAGHPGTCICEKAVSTLEVKFVEVPQQGDLKRVSYRLDIGTMGPMCH